MSDYSHSSILLSTSPLSKVLLDEKFFVECGGVRDQGIEQPILKYTIDRLGLEIIAYLCVLKMKHGIRVMIVSVLPKASWL